MKLILLQANQIIEEQLGAWQYNVKVKVHDFLSQHHHIVQISNDIYKFEQQMRFWVGWCCLALFCILFISLLWSVLCRQFGFYAFGDMEVVKMRVYLKNI